MPEPIHFGVGVDNLRQLTKDLRQAAEKELAKELRSALRAGVNLVRDRARTNFAWSSRIPGSITTSVSVSGGSRTGARVTAGGDRAPHAAAFENHGQAGFFRHPVFANRGLHGDRSVPWVDQRARPGLIPALISEADAVVDLVEKGIDQAFKNSGAH